MALLAPLRRQGAALLLSSSRAAGLATSAAEKKAKEDEFEFKERCKGTRTTSTDAEEVREWLRKTDFRRGTKPPAATTPGTGQGDLGTAAPAAQQQQQRSGLHTRTAAAAEQRSADDAAQEIVEKGSKRMMQSEEGREELRQGSFDLDQTTKRVAEEGAKDASPEAAARKDEPEVKEAIRSRVTTSSQGD